VKKINFVILSLSLGSLNLSVGDNIYMGDGFNEVHSAINESYVRTIAKNRASNHRGGGSTYVEIKDADQFKDALKSGELSQTVNGNGITKTYRVIDIKNVRLGRDDLKDIEGDRVLIGSKVERENEQLVQNISIRNSRLKTDKKLNVGVVSTTEDVDGIQSSVKIKNTQLKSSHKSRDRKRDTTSRLDKFDSVEDDF
jgi:hypothetical protein